MHLREVSILTGTGFLRQALLLGLHGLCDVSRVLTVLVHDGVHLVVEVSLHFFCPLFRVRVKLPHIHGIHVLTPGLYFELSGGRGAGTGVPRGPHPSRDYLGSDRLGKLRSDRVVICHIRRLLLEGLRVKVGARRRN